MNLAEQYRAYIACLNERRWQDLGDFVDDDVQYNGERISVAGYRAMLENDVRKPPSGPLFVRKKSRVTSLAPSMGIADRGREIMGAHVY